MAHPEDHPTRREIFRRAVLLAAAAAAGRGGRRVAAAVSGEAPAAVQGEAPAAAPGAPRQRKAVVVIGAGAAGLAAATELAARGHTVTVLEAQERPGGRIRTLREPFADGLYVEAGALSFSSGYRHCMRYVKQLGLPTAKLDNHPGNVVYHLRGKRLAAKAFADPKEGWPYELTAAERGLGRAGMFEKYFAPADKMTDPTAPDFPLADWRRWDDVTMAQFLGMQGASAAAVELLGRTLWFGWGWDQGAALHRLLSDFGLYYLGQTALAIPGGCDLLPQAMARALGDRVRYRAAVEKVLQQAGRAQVARVVYRDAAGTEQGLDADRVVCTVPLPALRKILFEPGLPERKRQIVEQLAYNPVTRIYLQTRSRFWSAAGDAGAAFTDLPIQQVTEQPFVRPAAAGGASGAGGGRGILECHVKGPEALRLAGLDPAARLAFAVEELEKVHPGFKQQYETGTSVAWSADPWAGGAYAWWRPNELTGWQPELARAEELVHFAGEHTSLLGRTIEGALESGHRAAQEIDLAA